MTTPQVTVITDPTDPTLDTLHALGESSYDPAVQCSPGSFWPARNDFTRCLEAGGAVYYTGTTTEPTAFVLADSKGHVQWVEVPESQITASFGALAFTVQQRTGACLGVVRNDSLRQTLAASVPDGHAKDRGQPTCVLYWQ